jgi:hypothetical protein
MMLVVATTCPLGCAPIVEAVESEFNEVLELVAGKVADPDSWLARGALGTPIPFILSMTSMCVATGTVFMRRREA